MSDQISKATKSEKTKEAVKSSVREEPDPVLPTSCDSPTSSKSSGDSFQGFDNVALSEEQLKKQEALQRLLLNLEASRNVSSSVCSLEEEQDTAVEQSDVEDSETGRDEEMTVDTDSDQMEIDISNDKENSSKADSVDLSDVGTNRQDGENRTRDSDVDVVETDSVKSGGDKSPSKSQKAVGNKTDSKVTNSSILESTLKGGTKVEYCGGCGAEVDDAEEGICCDGDCERWFHLRCSGLSQAEYDELGLDENAKWACSKCSGTSPPSLGRKNTKPLLTVRKDLGTLSTPSPKRRSMNKDGRTPRVDISNPAFLKPFDFGWKRELVYRSTNDSQNRRQGDIYYYTPKGKKLRSLREISDHLVGTDLTQDNFTFWKEPLGIDDPEKEIIRDAKFKMVNKDPLATPTLPKKVTPKITKTPKPAPKLTATVTPMDSSNSVTPKASASITPRVVFKGKANLGTGPKIKVTPTKAATTPSQTQKVVISKDKKKKSTSDDELEMGMLPPTWESVSKSKDKLGQEVCSISCLKAMGLIPTLQCHICLCLFHPECVGLEEAKERIILSYKCKNCQQKQEKPKPPTTTSSKLILPPPPLTPISTLSTTGTSQPPMAPPKLLRMANGKSTVGPRGRLPLTKATSIVGGVTTWLPPSSTIQLRPSPPTTTKMSPFQRPLPPTTTTVVDSQTTQPVQTLVSMDCKRYIVVPKHNVLSVSPATTSSAQVTDPVTTHITTSASDPSTTVSALVSQAFGPGGPILPKPQVSTSAAFIVGSPTSTTSTFQNPPGVLLVPYIAPQSQTNPIQKDGQQPQYIVVNGPSGLQPGNFIIGNIPQQQQLKLPTVPTSQPAEPPPESAGVKRPLEVSEETPQAKRARREVEISKYMQNFVQHISFGYSALLHSFQYLKVQELLRASRVCHLWRDMALHRSLWETVRMKNSQVKDWEGFAATLRSVGTKHLDLRKILMPDKQEALKTMWIDCVKALSKVNTLVKLDLCRCTSNLLEQIAAVCPQLEYISAGAIKSSVISLKNLGNCANLTELKLKGQGGLEVEDASVLMNLTKLKHLSLTVVKNMSDVLEVVGKMTQLESLELGEMINVTETQVIQGFSQLTKLKRLRLEKGQQDCPTDAILRTISQLPSLIQLELINFDVKAGFEVSLARCSNIKILLMIPTYVTQSATTNHLVMEGVSKLSKTLNHFVWGLTLELLRVTDLFIDQWEMGQKNTSAKSPTQNPQKKSGGDSIPILKPAIVDGKKPKEGAVTQVDVLQLPKLHKVLTALLPNTKIIILKVPFSATWRQTIAGSNQGL
ncbi:uncharacterized protein LOC124357693 isoform X2 [Homalodisca vitripennis]|uniref:uncharacterized protein LOC124357693 isoform X2 n=1 Tax=Homalodisca vitripennis TaxID=197043 RepID=UPI001EEBB3B4|nr:uncharacterized protein LOC124357693 isoform X2 [Homalodisca vitripennis]